MKKKGWFSVLQNLSWLTQLGLSLAAPPVLCLLGAAWSYVRYKNEYEDKERAEKDRKRVRPMLIAAAAALVIFLALKFAFPVS